MSDIQSHEEFERLFLPAQTALRGYLLAATGDGTATDDLFQNVATVLWRKFGEYDRSRSFTTWAIGMARLEVLKRRQTLARSRLVFSEAAVAALADAAAEVADDEDARLVHLRSCLGKLPVRERDTLDLRFNEKLSHTEIGGRLHQSADAVGMMLMRARRWLRDCMERAMAKERAAMT
jgi:RNA polymerase sigma-70 factor (ECF subfamily)